MVKGYLSELAKNYYPHDGTHKPYHVFDEFERLLEPRRMEPLRILELGVASGASLLVWRDYCPAAIIVGIDMNGAPSRLAERDDLHIVRGHQDDPTVIAKARDCSGGLFDLIIDDCAHIGHIAKRSFALLFLEHLASGGVYVIEDLGAAFWSGRFPDAEKFIAPSLEAQPNTKKFPSHTNGMLGFAKQLIDHLMSDVLGGPRTLPIERITFLSNVAFIYKQIG
jgi:hypothetical protein